MTKFAIDFSYNTTNWGTVELDADDKEQVEFDALNYIHDTYPEALDVEINNIKEI